MKRGNQLAFCAALAVAFWATDTMAATEAEKLAAIQNGLANLNSNAVVSATEAYWNYGGYEPAATGAALLAFVSQKDKWGPNTAAYQVLVNKTVAYLLGHATKSTVSTRNDGVNICPSGIGSCDAVWWTAANNEDSYTTGLIIPGLMTYAAGKGSQVATTTGPLAGMTWKEIAQANVNLWAASQSTANQGPNRRGGWRYILGNAIYDSDSSTTQWGIISLIYDQDLGAVIPAIVKTDLANWLAVVQVAGQGGAACYQPDYLICDHADTGALLLGLKYLGKTLGDTPVQNALGFLNQNWPQNANGTWYGNFEHPYAMWAVYKGLALNIGLDNTTVITNLKTDCGNSAGKGPGTPPGSKPCNWWEDYNEWLVRDQNPNGSWNGYAYWTGNLATAFYVNILGATQFVLCDVNNDGDIDQEDLSIISRARSLTPQPGDPADINRDGIIDARDVKACIPKCTLPGCAVPQRP